MIAEIKTSPGRTSKGRDSSDGYSSLSTSVETKPPRLVTPNPPAVSPTRDFVYSHKPTASSKHSGLNYVSPLKPKEPNMKYSLSHGLEKPRLQMGEKENKRFDLEKMPSSRVSKSSLQNRTITSKRRSSNGDVGSGTRKKDPSNYKIFILLLQPKLKTFELIQLIYSPNNTTVGNIIAMIPENATEPALGTQTYHGLCRPKTEEVISDLELLASEPRGHNDIESAKITLGEILVAIPDGYTGPDVAVLAKQILSNPKIVKLLKRSDPLAPKRSRRSSRRSNRPRRSRSKEHVDIMDKFDEEDEIKQEEERMKEAMEHAVQKAAASNAQIPGGASTDIPRNIGQNVMRSSSVVSLESSVGDETSTGSSLQESIDESYSSWSKSFDASFASSVCSGVSKRSIRRKDRHSRRMKIIQRSVAAGFVIMLAMYFMDPSGYGRSEEEKQISQAATTENPMGLTGILQCIFLLLSLYQIEAFIRTTTARSNDGEKRSSFIDYLQSTKAMKKLKARFAKKFKKTRSRRGAVGAYEFDETTRTQKLRNFSLKGSSHTRSTNIGDDTGSL